MSELLPGGRESNGRDLAPWSAPPVWLADRMSQRVAISGASGFIGNALSSYLDLVTPARTAGRAGWTYPRPSPGFEALVDHLAVMPGAMDACTIDGELVVPQDGGFYGGWITSRVVGPFKGGPGTRGW